MYYVRDDAGVIIFRKSESKDMWPLMNMKESLKYK